MAYRRGQAALEFLTTYGWAFLVILVMIGALAYFGVLSPNRFLPERCTFQQEMTCRDFKIEKGNGLVLFAVTNNLGSPINTIALNIGHVNNVSEITPCVDTTGGAIDQQATHMFSCDISGLSVTPGLPAGAKTKFIVSGTYRELGGYYDRATAGEIYATVQQ